MRKLIKNALLITITGMMSSTLQATNLNINGTVVASSCNVDSGSVNQDVDFGPLRSSDLKDNGTATIWIPFTVRVTQCPISTNRVTATFSGTPSTDDITLFANSGTAGNVAVQIAQNADKSVVQGNGSSMTMNVDAQHNAVFDLASRIYSVHGNTTAGSFNSTVLINFTYQ
ncbi:fimbrial protein [Serratia sp. N21D137]|uniref:fimbrial protein n=1 Tax=Serratia sp. N21D137 TaxID=3397495 RepID=UPI0039E05590